MITGKINEPVTMTADTAGDWLQAKGKNINLRVALDGKSASFTPSSDGLYVFHCGDKTFEVQVGDTNVPPVEQPPVEQPPTPTGDVLYDSTIHSKLHDGKVRTVDSEGSITPNGLGIECRASGNPRIVVNADGTFSLVCDAGHGRIYGYVLNYNATLEIECAFWNKPAGQDISLKMRSRHNEGGAGDNRFGGYGFSFPNGSNKWDAKREVYHNVHDEAENGTLPITPETQKYFTIEFTVKDENGKVRQTAKVNGQQCMSKLDSSPKPYMIDQASFAKQSYFWVRSNIDSGSGEIRIKRLRILKA